MIDKRLELLSPAGNMEKLYSALHFGADAVYLSGKNYGLRAFGENFDHDEMVDAIKLVHSLGKKAYVTVNIFAHNDDFGMLSEYLQFLESAKPDALIISDPGIIYLSQKITPSLELHLSTQANTTNKYSAAFWANNGISRIVLARELSLGEIKEIRNFLPDSVELEAFVHGAMCMAYSGRCLLSNFLAGRPSNRGECSQSCRWEYALSEKKRPDEQFEILEDSRGSYILNSKDLCMLKHIDKLVDAGIQSFKIEGRVKSSYYAGVITGAYRRAIDAYLRGETISEEVLSEPYKTSHRSFTTGFYFDNRNMQDYEKAKPDQSHEFSAIVAGRQGEDTIIEMRNRFKEGDILEVVSPSQYHNAQLPIFNMRDLEGNPVSDALNVQQKLLIESKFKLDAGDMLRKKLAN